MSIKKTIGGERLGSGNKMQVEMHGFERSTQNLSYLWRSTMSAGTLVPFLVEVALPGDTFDIDLNAEILTHPTIGPLFGSEKVQLDVFLAPMRLYNAAMHNNMLGIGMKMNTVFLPQVEMKATSVTGAEDVDNAQINPSCVLAYLGLRGVGIPDSGAPDNLRRFNGVPYLMYWDVYKNYYANKAEGIGAFISCNIQPVENTVTSITKGGTTLPVAGGTETNIAIFPGENLIINYTGAQPKVDQIYVNTSRGVFQISQLGNPVSGGVGQLSVSFNSSVTGIVLNSWRYRLPTDTIVVSPFVETFDLDNIDTMRTRILQAPMNAPFIVNDLAVGEFTPYDYVFTEAVNQAGMNFAQASQEGLAIKTYQSDLFNNWIDTEFIDGPSGIAELTKVDTTDGGFTVDTLLMARKVYDMLNRVALSGGTYDDWLDVQYGTERVMRATTPMYMGGLSKELVFQEVVSNAGGGEGQPLGTLAGKGVMSKKHKGGHITIKVDEPSYIMGIISLTPRIDYSQGNRWDMHLKTMDDLHKPMLDQIGFQDLICEGMAWWSTKQANNGEWQQKSAGKQPAWINYMTNYNRVYGNFAIESNEMFMTFNRRYEWDGSGDIADLTSYIDPTKFNFIFAETALDAQNYWAQVSVDMTARRKMSAKQMPNL